MDKKVVTDTRSSVHADLIINSKTPIFETYRNNVDSVNFKDHFYSSLNPDNAPEGFLEQLASILEIAGKGVLLIRVDPNDCKEKSMFNVIKEYIESQ